MLLKIGIEVDLRNDFTTPTAMTIVIASRRIGLGFDRFDGQIKWRFSLSGARCRCDCR